MGGSFIFIKSPDLPDEQMADAQEEGIDIICLIGNPTDPELISAGWKSPSYFKGARKS
jgi:hypothetical protein